MGSESSTALAPLVVLRQFMDVESVYGYRKGGFHPVHIDDVPHNRHQVLHKLGHGSYGTVWLSEDLTSGRFVSVKILPANARRTSQSSLSFDTSNRTTTRIPDGNTLSSFWTISTSKDLMALISASLRRYMDLISLLIESAFMGRRRFP